MVVYPLTKREAAAVQWFSRVVAVVACSVLVVLVAVSLLIS